MEGPDGRAIPVLGDWRMIWVIFPGAISPLFLPPSLFLCCGGGKKGVEEAVWGLGEVLRGGR